MNIWGNHALVNDSDVFNYAEPRIKTALCIATHSRGMPPDRHGAIVKITIRALGLDHILYMYLELVILGPIF